MSNSNIPPLPNSRERHRIEGGGSGGVLGMLAACSGGVAIFAVGASLFLLFQEDATMSAAGLVLGGLAMLAALIALILGFVVVVSIEGKSRSAAVTGMVSGAVTVIAVIVVSVMGMYRAAEKNFKLTEIGIQEEKPPVAPIVVKKSARTENDNDKLWKQWFDENLDQPMKARLAGKPWEKEGLQAVEAFPSTWLTKWGQLSKAEWQEIGAGLVRKKCDDPLLLYLVSRSCDMGLNHFNILIKASKDIGTSSDLSPVWALMAELDKSVKVEYGDEEEDRRPTDAEVLRRLKRACEAGCFEGEQVWMLDHLLVRGDGKKFTKRYVFKIAEVFEKSAMPEWAVHWMRGYGELLAAWKSRGSGYSNKVSEAGWKGFREHSALAREELVKSWELAPEYPFAAALMIKVSMGGSDDPLKEMRMWWDRSMDAQIDNWTAMTNYKFGLYPRWHGSRDMLGEFAGHCMDTERYDTYLPWMQMLVEQQFAKESSDKVEYYRDEEVYHKLMTMLDGYLADAGKVESVENTARKQVYWTYQMILSQRAGYDDVLPGLWEKLNGKLHEKVIEIWKVDCEDLEFRAVIGLQDSRIHNAENYIDQALYDEALSEYEAVLAQTDLSDKKRRVLRNRIALLQMRKQWEAGEWVTLWPTDSADLWKVLEGKRLPDAGGALKFQSDSYRYVAEHPFVLGRNYEIEAKVGPAGGIWGTTGYGIWLSTRPWNGKHWDCLKLRVIANDQLSLEAVRWRFSPEWSTKIKRKEPVLIGLQCQGVLWNVSVDGHRLNTADVEMTGHHNGDNTRMALAGYVRPEGKTTVSYQSVRVRKLEAREE